MIIVVGWYHFYFGEGTFSGHRNTHPSCFIFWQRGSSCSLLKSDVLARQDGWRARGGKGKIQYISPEKNKFKFLCVCFNVSRHERVKTRGVLVTH